MRQPGCGRIGPGGVAPVAVVDGAQSEVTMGSEKQYYR